VRANNPLAGEQLSPLIDRGFPAQSRSADARGAVAGGPWAPVTRSYGIGDEGTDQPIPGIGPLGFDRQ
jgi:hypothetical protein